MTDVNIPLLRKGVEWVEEQERLNPKTRSWMQEIVVVPESYRVQRWSHEEGCGSAYCFGGYIAELVRPGILENYVRLGYGDSPIVVAAEALGIDPDTPSEEAVGFGTYGGIFSMNNSAADIRRIAERLAGQKL